MSGSKEARGGARLTDGAEAEKSADGAVGPGDWFIASAPLRRELANRLDAQRLRELHRTSGWRHGLVALRQLLLLVACGFVIVSWPGLWWAWVPAAVLLGFIVFAFTVLLHEVVHRAVLRNRSGRMNRVLAWAYALPSGISSTQFTRWHLDHHAQLGNEEADPKRHHLTPKIVKRWYKLLYMTPALFPIYFRAAKKETATYREDVQTRIRWERRATILTHVLIAAAIYLAWGAPILLKLYVVPVFFVFPVAFTLNRLGQHYDIDPSDPAAWGTIIKTNPVWNLLFLWSSFHMEHHYFPGVPFYNLPALHKELRPILEAHPMRVRTYSGLLWDWLANNKAPHTDWS